jgi:Flp pilus assembly protein TadG
VDEPRKNKGSTTVEAAILVPLIFISILAVIFLCCLYYQRALLQSAADSVAHAGAASWFNPASDIATGKTEINNLEETGLYWRIIEEKRDVKLNRIKTYSERILNKKAIFEPYYSNTKVEIKDYIIYKRLHVCIENSYKLPGTSLFKIFGVGRYIKINVSAYANINDPSEFIRDTDLLLDIEKEMENKYPGLKQAGEKTREVLSRIKDNIGKFTR